MTEIMGPVTDKHMRAFYARDFDLCVRNVWALILQITGSGANGWGFLLPRKEIHTLHAMDQVDSARAPMPYRGNRKGA